MWRLERASALDPREPVIALAQRRAGTRASADDHGSRVDVVVPRPGDGGPVTRILCYHDVVAAAESEQAGFPGPISARYKLSPNQFERHLDALTAIGSGPGMLEQRPDVALTFDDGGASGLRIADALESRGLRGHFFIVTGRLGAAGFLDAGAVRELATRGHAIGSHSHTHPPYIERLAPGALEREWRASAERLAELLDQPPRLAAVPGGRLSGALLAAVAAAGYELLLSCEPTARVRHDGPLTVRGRYMIWADTPAARAASYARGDRGACASAERTMADQARGARRQPGRLRARAPRPGGRPALTNL